LTTNEIIKHESLVCKELPTTTSQTKLHIVHDTTNTQHIHGMS